MNKTGVIEGFFGPQWPNSDRKSYAKFLNRYGAEFYIYAPKQDPNLRKQWRNAWDEHYLNMLRDLVKTFHEQDIQFGVGFSPFGLGEILSDEDKKNLADKLHLMNDLGIDMLGLFFDDMPTNENLAQTQIAALKVIQQNFSGKIIFCPSYYTPDPILDKVFGTRPAHYLEELAAGINVQVAIAWTGPKVISPVIDDAHLKEVAQLLRRKPFIWENLFANDGPKNCKFLKLKPFTGRDKKTFLAAEAFGFNLMNQPQLSKILFLASKYVLDGKDFNISFEDALSELCTPAFKAFIIENQNLFLTTGLDHMPAAKKDELITNLNDFNDPAAFEIKAWLLGEYNVGSECLTD